MIHTLLLAAVFAVSPLYVSGLVREEEKAPQPQVKATYSVVISGDEGEVIDLQNGGDNAFVIAKALQEGDAQPYIALALAGEGEADGATFKWVGNGDVELNPDRGWLGVQVAEVDEALAAQFDLVDQGVMVVNVMEDSPAAEAGLERHDIVISIAGEPVASDVLSLVKAVGAFKTGDTIDITVLREGQEKTLTATLGTWAESQTGTWRFDVAPMAEIEDQIHTHGKMLFKDAGGEWTFKDLGDIEGLVHGLPADVIKMLPQEGTRSFTFRDGHPHAISLSFGDAKGVSISQKDDGPIVVTRTDENGDTATTEYATREELEAADPEAAKYLAPGGGHGLSFWIDIDTDDLNFDFDAETLKKHLHELHGDLGTAHVEARAAFEKAMKHMGDLGVEGEFDFTAPGNNAVFGDGAHSFAFKFGEPKNSFTVQPDGTIEVTIRDGDSEVVRVFTDEIDLQNRRPGLYEKFKALDDNEN